MLLFHPNYDVSLLLHYENLRCWYSLEAPRRGASNENPQHMVSCRNKYNRYSSYMELGVIPESDNKTIYYPFCCI